MNKPLSPEVFVVQELNKLLDSPILNTMISVVNNSFTVDFYGGIISVEGHIDFSKVSAYQNATEQFKNILIVLFKAEGYSVTTKVEYHLITNIRFAKTFQSLNECTEFQNSKEEQAS